MARLGNRRQTEVAGVRREGEAERGWECQPGQESEWAWWAPMKAWAFSWMPWKTVKGCRRGGQHEEWRKQGAEGDGCRERMGLEERGLG